MRYDMQLELFTSRPVNNLTHARRAELKPSLTEISGVSPYQLLHPFVWTSKSTVFSMHAATVAVGIDDHCPLQPALIHISASRISYPTFVVVAIVKSEHVLELARIEGAVLGKEGYPSPV